MSASHRRDPGGKQITVRPQASSEKPVRRAFPGPRGAATGLRVAVERAAYADLIAHAKESLEAEVCGVLVGQIGEDDEGLFVHVEALIRGNAATQAATHVTFTQATWEAIHQTLERDHPNRRIVGWYHTHPGFGVEFSDMDVFIQRNFFPGPTQIALVIDPLSGAVAIAINGASGIEYLPRFWVDGREQQAKAPARLAPATGGAGIDGGEPGGLATTVKALEARVGQLIQSQDEQRVLFQRVVLGVGLVLCVGIITAVGHLFYSQYNARFEPPRVNSFVPVPVKVGDKTVLMGVGIVEWDVPPELNSLLLQIEQAKREAAAKAGRTDEKNPAAPGQPALIAPPKSPANDERK